MKLYLDTSSPETIVRLDEKEYRWQSGRNLAEDLLAYLRDRLAKNNATWDDLTEIEFYAGPGSFTGLRIGAAVVNTLASELQVPLFNHHGEKVLIIIPEYGREANVSRPRK